MAQETETWLGLVGEIRHRDVMFTGRLGRFGSTPGLFVGIGFYKLNNIKGKVYYTVQQPGPMTALSVLHCTPRQTCTIQH